MLNFLDWSVIVRKATLCLSRPSVDEAFVLVCMNDTLTYCMCTLDCNFVKPLTVLIYIMIGISEGVLLDKG